MDFELIVIYFYFTNIPVKIFTELPRNAGNLNLHERVETNNTYLQLIKFMKSFVKSLPKPRYLLRVLFCSPVQGPESRIMVIEHWSYRGIVWEFLNLQMHRENVHLRSEDIYSTDNFRNILAFFLQFTVQKIWFCGDVC